MGKEKKERKSKGNKSPADVFAYYKNFTRKLRMDLHKSVAHLTQYKALRMEDADTIQDLNDKLRERDEKIKKINEEVIGLKQANGKAKEDARTFRETYYKLELSYDENITLLKKQIEKLSQEILKMNVEKNKQIAEITQRCDGLQQQCAEEVQACENLNKEYNSAMIDINELKLQLVENKKDFEEFKKAKELEAEALNKNFEDQLKNLQEELQKKELDVQRAVNDKENMEKEKDHIIALLQYRVREIKRVFCQPALLVQPRISNKGNNEIQNPEQTADENIAITKPMVYSSSSSDEEVPLQNLVQSRQNTDLVPTSNEQPECKRIRKRSSKRFEEPRNRSPSFLRSNSNEEGDFSSLDEWEPSVKRVKKEVTLSKTTSDAFDKLKLF
ncbi:uncharacterized protein At4g38062-like [Glossina fuscipes]|uniref:Uncharacterized protein At4g38062-like n=1 Tax=Glossina fuscipes TaxID=7396 RepID=A0A8U0WAT4_9MUSC|nr:uncharacterized protein At4g38062-like [Glossina fuscipes]